MVPEGFFSLDENQIPSLKDLYIRCATVQSAKTYKLHNLNKNDGVQKIDFLLFTQVLSLPLIPSDKFEWFRGKY